MLINFIPITGEHLVGFVLLFYILTRFYCNLFFYVKFLTHIFDIENIIWFVLRVTTNGGEIENKQENLLLKLNRQKTRDKEVCDLFVDTSKLLKTIAWNLV